MSARHRADRPARLGPPLLFYRPRHCAGTDCLHDHPNDHRPSIPLVRSQQEYAAARAEAVAAGRKPWEVQL